MNTDQRSNLLKKQFYIPQAVIDYIGFVILCIFSIQPLYGLTTTFTTNQDIVAHFFLKSNLARGLGWIALLLSIIYLFGQKQESNKKTLHNTFIKQPWNLCFTLLLAWSVLMQFHSELIYVSIFGNAIRYEGLIGYFAYAGFFAIASFIKRKDLVRWWFCVTLLIANLLAIISVYCLWFPNKYILPHMTKVTLGFSSTFPQYNHYGYYLAMMVLISAGLFLYTAIKWQRIFAGISFVIQLFTAFQNRSRGAFLAIIIGMIFLTLLSAKREDVTKKISSHPLDHVCRNIFVIK